MRSEVTSFSLAPSPIGSLSTSSCKQKNIHWTSWMCSAIQGSIYSQLLGVFSLSSSIPLLSIKISFMTFQILMVLAFTPRFQIVFSMLVNKVSLTGDKINLSTICTFWYFHVQVKTLYLQMSRLVMSVVVRQKGKVFQLKFLKKRFV